MYKELYVKLFKGITKTIAELQEIQQQCEEIFMAEEAGAAGIPLQVAQPEAEPVDPPLPSCYNVVTEDYTRQEVPPCLKPTPAHPGICATTTPT